MKLTNMEADQVQAKLTELGKRDDIPFKASLDIAIISNMIEIQLKTYGAEIQKLLQKCFVRAEAGEQEGTTSFVCIEEVAVLDKEANERHGVTWHGLAKLENGGELIKKMIDEIPEVARIAKKHGENITTFVEKWEELRRETGKELDFQKIKLPADLVGISPETLKPLVEFVEIG